jgi:copper(I)-binding protein
MALIGLLALGLAAPAEAQSGNAQSIEAVNAWARATPLGAKNGAAYMKLVNHDASGDQLVGAASPVAGAAQLHVMSLDNGVMMMRPAPSIEVKAGETVALDPDGFHVMLLDLKQPLVQGHSFPLTLFFKNLGRLQVSVRIGGMGDMSAPKP